jgi:glutathionyl-hydroquinone reductase
VFGFFTIYIYIACFFYYRTLIKRKVLGLGNSTKITKKKRREKEHNKKKEIIKGRKKDPRSLVMII